MKRGAVLILMGILGFILISGNQHSKKTNKEKPNIKSESPSIGIQFIQSEWSKVIEMAADEDKLIFVDLYSTACKPCELWRKRFLPIHLLAIISISTLLMYPTTLEIRHQVVISRKNSRLTLIRHFI